MVEKEKNLKITLFMTFLILAECYEVYLLFALVMPSNTDR